MRFGIPAIFRALRGWAAGLRALPVSDKIATVVAFVVGYAARDLSFSFFGWPFSFWMGAQGALIVYVALIWYYARTMNRLDREYGVDEEEEQ